MSIRNLRTLVAVADHGSFAAAARAVGLTQSAVSMQLRGLEDELRVRLFDRRRRPPTLNDHGKRLVRRAREILELYERMADAPGASVDGMAGLLEVGAIPTALSGIVPKALAGLQKIHPNIAVNLVNGMSGELLPRVERGELDAALISEPSHVQADLVWRPIATEKIIVAAPPQSTEKTDRELLAAWPYIRYNRRAWVARPIQQSLRARGLRPRQAMELDSIESILLMVYFGLGVAIVPQRCVEGPYPLPVRYVPFGEPPLTRRIGLIERVGNPKSGLVGALHAAFAGLAAR
ncbi:MAG: LysR family transcriptional regulator [Alphaproteobacteria bacterium]|nr:LysR family transcriptional regulator [Alphaproteobacteria bacterium]MBM3949824.1 LysR family transcriptional regulator [Rhodospirillales bacterium]